MKLLLFVILASLVLHGCGALEAKRFPDDETVTRSLFPAKSHSLSKKTFNSKISQLLENNSDKGPHKVVGIFSEIGHLFVINTVPFADHRALDQLMDVLRDNPNISSISRVNIPTLPNIKEIRLLSAKHGARYTLLINEFANNYQYHNAWTIPSVLGLGIPYFFLDTQTVMYFSKLEATVIDIENNMMLLNESATASTRGKSTLPDSGILTGQLKQQALSDGMKSLHKKLANYL